MEFEDEELPSWGSSDNSSDVDSEADSDLISRVTVQNVRWKPKSETTYETLVLTRSEFNAKIRGAGFRTDGQAR